MCMRLSYDEHITKLVSKCIKSLCQINRIKHILDDYTLITVINALVFSRLYTTTHLCGRTIPTKTSPKCAELCCKNSHWEM